MRKTLIAFLALIMILNIALSAMATEEVPLPAVGTVAEGVAEQSENAAEAAANTEPEPVAVTAPEQTVEAQETSQAASENTWYELTRDEMGADVLTVHLKGNVTTGFNWMFDISDPEMLELLTEEYVEDAVGEGMVGVGGTWHASFRNFGGKAGNVTLALGYGRSWEEEPVELHVLEMEVNELGQIGIVAVDPGDDLNDFYNPEGYDVLRVTNVFTGEDGVLRLQASFGSVGDGGEFIGFGDENSYLFAVIPECVLMLPENLEDPAENLPFEQSLLDWYSKARAAWAPEGEPLAFYAAFEMNEAAEITRLSYIYLS